MTQRQQASFTPRTLERLRMLADWQIRQEGYDPDEITALCRQADERREEEKLARLTLRLEE